MEKFATKNGVSLYAYRGDAMTLLAFDLEESLLEHFVGFTIHVKAADRQFYIYNKIQFAPEIALPDVPEADYKRLSTEFSPIQKFRWVHVPSTIHYVDRDTYFGDYTYQVTPRYLVDRALVHLDVRYTVEVTIEVAPFKDGDIEVGFARSFISSQAFAYHFGNQLNLRPNKTDLQFDLAQIAGSTQKWVNGVMANQSFTYEKIHSYLGWQARARIIDFLDTVLGDNGLCLDVFAYDLNEPLIVEKLLQLASEGRLRVILDNIPAHIEAGCYEMKFEQEFINVAPDQNALFRGHFGSQAHSKVFIVRENNAANKAIKVLTGSTNFTTNGLYINANHVVIFHRAEVAQLYGDVFDASFGEEQMKSFKKSNFAQEDFIFGDQHLPDMTIRFAPHPKSKTDEFFATIECRILEAESDVLFAVMMDASNSVILDALREQVKSAKVFTYGISDTHDAGDIYLYKPSSRQGVKVSGLEISKRLPEPFKDIIGVPGLGHLIHHKFVVVDFKGANPVAWVGSSNLAYKPEQQNGDNLIEIRDKDVVTVFAIEAIRLVDHYHWLNKEIDASEDAEVWYLADDSKNKKWYNPYYNKKDLKYLERTLLMK